MVSLRAITSPPLARTRTRARPLLIFLLACFIAACLVTTASRSHKNERSRYLVSAEDTRELWPTPTAKDFDVLRSVPTHRPRRYANLRVVFEFAWYNGLTNMEYAAISSFILAKSMGAEVLMPRGQVRSSFKLNQQKKTVVPTRDIWDVDKIKDMWADVGLTVHEAGVDFGEDVHAINIPGGLFWRLNSIGGLRKQVWEAVDKVLKDKPLENDTKILKIHTDHAHFALDVNTCRDETIAAAVMLPFAPRHVELARTVIRTLREHGWSKFNGAHLRLEQDGLRAFAKTAGFDGVLNAYVRSFDILNLNSSLPMYVATGIIATGGEEWEKTQKTLLQGHASALVYLNNVVPSIAIDGIPCEQLATVDMMVLAASEVFVGAAYSTFSIFVSLLRARLGYSRELSTLMLPSNETAGFMNRLRRGSYVLDLRTMSLD